MSGIAGVFGLDGRPVEAAEVGRMIAASSLATPDAETDNVWVHSSFGLGCRPIRITPESLAEDQPLVSSSQTALCFDGRLDNRDELARFSTASDAAVAIEAYQQSGDGVAGRLNGDFALAVCDPSRQQLLLARDVMGARRLYYCQIPGAVLFATEIKCLLADPRVSASPDEDGLADLVLNNWHDDHRTCFKGIYSVPAGHLVIVTRNGITVRPHWAFDPSRQIRCGSFDEYRERFRLLFEQSVRRRLRSAHPVAVTVSGGVDSSSIFCQAAALARGESCSTPIHGIAMTFPAGTAADERVFLEEIERAYGTQIARVPVTDLQFLTNAAAVVRHLETPSLAAHSHAEVIEQARRAGCRVILHGYFGDQMLFCRDYLIDLARQGRWLRVRHDLREFAAWMTDEDPGVFAREFWLHLMRATPAGRLLRLVKRGIARFRAPSQYSPVFTSAFRERARERASARFHVSRRFASAHAEQCYRYAMSGHCAGNVRLESGIASMQGVETWYPFRDRDLVEFLMAIPGEIVNWQGVPKGVLRHALTGVLPDAVRNRRWKADFTNLNQEVAAGDRANLARLQPANSLAIRSGLVDGDVLAQAERLHWQLPDPIGLELWLQEFFADAGAAGR